MWSRCHRDIALTLAASFPSYPPSVWSDPGCWPVPGIDNFAEYLFQRADLDVLLGHLSGKILVCDCHLHGSHCYGAALLDAAESLCDVDGPPGSSGFDSDCCDEYDADHQEDEPILLRPGSFDDQVWQEDLDGPALKHINESMRGNPASTVRFPDEWRALADRVRSHPTRLFWELFAGIFVVTSIMLQ